MAIEAISNVVNSVNVSTVSPVRPTATTETKDVSAVVNNQAVSSAGEAVISRVTTESGYEQQQQDQEERQPSERKIKQTVSDINRKLNNNTFAEFGYHEGTNRVTIKIVDKDTKEVIREIPPEKTLDLIAKAWELAGILVDEKR